MSVTDPRFPPVLAAREADGRGHALLWVAGTLRTVDGPVRARLAIPPAVAGFDADGDGHGDVLSVAPGGRAVLTFGPFAGPVHNDPDAPGFVAERSVIYETGGESVAHRVWWVPDVFGPGRGAVAAQCGDDLRVGSCPSGWKTMWWPVAAPCTRPGGPRGFPSDGPGGRWLLPVGDLDSDGTADVLTDDGTGRWVQVRDLATHARLGPAVGFPHDGAPCSSWELPFAPDTIAVGDGSEVVVTGRSGGRWGVLRIDTTDLEDLCGR